MARTDGKPTGEKRWRMRLRKVLMEWARGKELPVSAIVELEIEDGRANVVVTETVDNSADPPIECQRQD